MHPLKPFDYRDADIMLVTHDHDDHYNTEEIVAAVKKTNAVVVGPPSITYPLLVDYNLPARNLRILYHQYRLFTAMLQKSPRFFNSYLPAGN